MFEPKGILIHSMGEFINNESDFKYRGKVIERGIYSASEWLTLLGLSVHGLVTVDGKYQKIVPSTRMALHAGKSKHMGLNYLNKHYLGVEILVEGAHTYGSFKKAIKDSECYNDEQIRTLMEVCRWWMFEYNIPMERVVLHSEVSGDDVRGEGNGKIDPGSGFDFSAFKEMLL